MDAHAANTPKLPGTLNEFSRGPERPDLGALQLQVPRAIVGDDVRVLAPARECACARVPAKENPDSI